MKGMELARKYYETYGEPMLKRDFPELYPLVAAGLFGSGSECFGFDDEVSRDHDFEPGFCLLLPGEAKVKPVRQKTAEFLKGAPLFLLPLLRETA